MTFVEMKPEDIEKAIKRHEDAFEKELEQVDVRAVVLKTKKAVLEQVLRVTTCENELLNYRSRISELERKVDRALSDIDTYAQSMTFKNDAITEALKNVQAKLEEQANRKSLFRRFVDFISGRK